MPESTHIRVFVVEDHPVVRLGLRTMLESDPGIAVVGMACSGREALDGIGKCSPHVVLMDLRMPDMDGIQTITALRLADPTVKVVVLTNYHSDEDVFNALRQGAMAYLLKSASLEEVLDAIRAVHAGERRIPPNIALQLANRVSRARISQREQEVLELVARGLTNKEIGELLHISDKTVRNHVINCLDKLCVKDRTEAIAVAIQRGLIAVNHD
jgi:DNA-binding NarL/FixJ family response regulator